MATKSDISYESLNDELENIMSELQDESLDIDLALKHYQRGLELVKSLEDYLKNSENKINELKAAFDKK